MNRVSEELYNEFLDVYQLNRSFFLHAVELSEPRLAKIEQLQVLSFQKFKVPVSEAVKNSVTFRNELRMAEIQADRQVREIIKGFRTFRMDEEDMYRLCNWLVSDALGMLLWPFHLLTVEAELEKDDFYPIANEMAGIVCDFLDLIDWFCDSFMAAEGKIQQQTQSEIAQSDRRTREWAANAPVEVFGTARVIGNRLHIDATARSTVTEGQIAADYQAHRLVANQIANRKRDEQQKVLLEQLESGLRDVIKKYIPAWYDCLENKLGYMVGKNVITSTIYGTAANAHPHIKDCAQKLLSVMTDEDSLDSAEYFLDYYDYDYDTLYGDKLVAQMFNDYVRNKQVNENAFHYRLFCQCYNKKHPVEHRLLFQRLKKRIQKQVRERCEADYQKNKEQYAVASCDTKMGGYYRFIAAVPGLTEQQQQELMNACRYVYYDVMGDTKTRDRYDGNKNNPVFNYDPE